MPRVRIVLADDHPIVRSGLTSVLASQPDCEVVGEAGDGEAAIALARALAPDVVLMDLRMPGVDGVEATRRIAREDPRVRVLVLTTYASDAAVLQAVAAGAVGYLLKDAPPEELFRAVRAVARGERYLAPAATARLVAHHQRPRGALTARERDVLEQLARGASNKAIAARLGISEPTVKAHLVHVFEKLGADSRTAAVRAALDRGLIDLY